ncbi:hypothetical protein ABZ760_03535, partial [Streptomyces sp. NPDC006658]|uniref:hypothetical protein n=1 Tax=Streptomyces sp. NPDC006658 TaxID=3156900 RepID=UPI0033E6ED10
MDPINPGPEDHGQAHSRRPPRDPLASDLAPGTPMPARMDRLVCGGLQLTVNPVDGSEIDWAVTTSASAAPALYGPSVSRAFGPCGWT